MEKSNHRGKKIGAWLLASVAAAGIMTATTPPAYADEIRQAVANSPGSAMDAAIGKCFLLGYRNANPFSVDRIIDRQGATVYLATAQCHN